MRAVICRAYGGTEHLEIVERALPEPGPGEIRVRLCAGSVSAGDWRIRSLSVPTGYGLMVRLAFGWSGPRQPVLGTAFSGIVEAVGEGVTRFAPHDEVFGSTGMKMGAHAEAVVLPETGAVVHKPHVLSHAQAAALPFGASTALQFLRDKGRLRSGERLCVVGAAGAVGTAAVQIGRAMGAHVTAVCSAANADLVRDLGAREVIAHDEDEEPFAVPDRFDVILDTIGRAPMRDRIRALAPKGRLLVVSGGMSDALRAPLPRAGGRRVKGGVAQESRADMEEIARLVEAGDLRAVIDSRYALSDIARAYDRVATGRKRGAVVLDPDEG
ncbi:MAG: NAD(P)-dependent alcohol dehydrogenase [Limimaricola soesokkakensis]|uniref:NAD(P)-dependent alcohol dehydrogenase n=1 Tax=Limimaricola soesokkakensis TaxID=1343159 RepID=UPI00405A183E